MKLSGSWRWLFAMLALPLVAAAAEPAPVLSYFRNPDMGRAALSPSGRWLAVTTAVDSGRVVLAIVDLDDRKPSVHVVASYSDVDIASVEWVNDDRLVYNVADQVTELPSERFGPGLYSVRRDGSETRQLIRNQWTPPISTGRGLGVQPLEPNHQLLRTLDDGSDNVIVGEYSWTPAGEPAGMVAQRLDVVTGHTSSISFGAPDHTFGWLVDRTGNPRITIAQSRGMTGVWRRDADGKWSSLAQYSSVIGGIVPLAVDDANHLFVETSYRGYGAVKRIDLTTGHAEDTALISARGFDLDARPQFEQHSSRLLGFRYQTDAEATTWFDPRMRALQTLADERFPGHINTITCRRCGSDDGVMLVSSYSDRDPGSFWLYRMATKTWDAIGRKRRDIDPSTMATLDFTRIKARDGEDLPLWITKPAGKADAPRPAVVLVHGGPWVRGGQWGWDHDAQFLASRGYVVIEPEFRGSLGYGSAHYRKGFKQWGLTMEDDLVDATRWAAGEGLIDPKRVCIAGASYGGYATLMGLVRDPDTFRCGVAWVAVTDPRLLFENIWQSDMSQESRQYSLPAMVGDLDTDAALLKDAAPIEHVKEMRAPLLMAFGREDHRVPLVHGTTLNDALKAAGHEPEFVIYDGEGHGWLKVANRVDWWTRVERFLAKELN